MFFFNNSNFNNNIFTVTYFIDILWILFIHFNNISFKKKYRVF